MDVITRAVLLGGVFVIAAWLARARPVVLLVALVGWFAIQQLVANLLWGLSRDASLAQSLILSKEFAILGALVGVSPAILAGLRKRHTWLAVAAIYVFIVLAFVPFVLMSQPLDQTLRGVRALAMPAAIGVLGYGVLAEPRQLRRLIDVVLFIAAATSIFAIFERIFIPDSFWTSIDIRGYWIEVKGLSPNTISPLGLPGNFYAYFTGEGTEYRRTVGSLGDPLGLSYFLVTPMLLAVAGALSNGHTQRPWRLLVAVACAAAIGLSLSRLPAIAAASGTALLILWAWISRRRLSLTPRSVMPTVAPVAVLVAMFVLGVAAGRPSAVTDPGSVGGQSQVDPSVATHVDRLLSTDLGSVILGRGPGSYGILTSRYTSTGTEVTSSENVYLDIAMQVGLVGAVAFALLLIVPIPSLVRSARGPAWDVNAGILVSALTLALAGVLTPQLLVVTSLGPFWMVLGGCMRSAIRTDPEGSTGPEFIEGLGGPGTRVFP